MGKIQLALTTLTLAAAVTVVTRPIAAKLTRFFVRIARRRVLAPTLVAVFALLVNSTMALLVHMPVPGVRDEFSHLLAADTFSQGRLTNPTHPMWHHFDSEHIIHQPSYQSKYPPGQGMVLALGQVWFGHPIAGVWISLALAGAALCWMLQAWMPGRWAFLGGILSIANVGVFQLWGQTYWGGALAMLGGALVFGAMRRIISKVRYRHTVLFVIGLVILASTRPYEGLVASVPAIVLLSAWCFSGSSPAFQSLTKYLLVPAAAVLLMAFLAMGYYNWRVTNDAFRLPYQVWMDQRGISVDQVFVRTVDKNSAAIGTMQSSERGTKKKLRHQQISEIARRPITKTVKQYIFYVGIPLTLPFLMLPFVVRGRWEAFAAITCAAVVTAIFLNTTAGYPHYTAPVAPLFMFLILQSLRRIRFWRCRGVAAGRFLARMVPTHALLFFVAFLSGPWRDQPVAENYVWSQDRARLETGLMKMGGEHLIMVRYEPDHNLLEEWVYNKASIDDSPVVWARELGDGRDEKLLAYFEQRTVWLLEPDTKGATLAPIDSR